ncbi:MAG: ABC transporter substrate-binding protein [Bacteroidetes bacterium]|nr:ABC transporter substrate-binding protein [Bacteroidota bacterium]
MAWYSATDQMGRVVELKARPERIISLVPSQTELLYDLGAGDQVIGITRYCTHPAQWRKEKKLVGGTKRPEHTLISKLQPDLIIGNKEENRREDIVSLEKQFPVWMSDVVTFEDAFSMIQSVAALTGHETEGKTMITSIQSAFSSMEKFRSLTVLYLIWHKPWMAVGSGTFIHSMLTALGLVNVVANEARYPMLTDAQMTELHPDLVFLSSEPYPFFDTHLKEVNLLFPRSRILKVDGEMFSWYGSRLAIAPAYFNSLQI